MLPCGTPDNMGKHLDKQSLCQFGFQRNTSTLQQLLLFFHELVTRTYEADVIYVDFRKTFDCVPHKKLLMKLWNMGITGNGLDLISLTEPNVYPSII